MKVLIACEYSGIVRDAFKARGHDAWSCDILPTERPGQHIVNDVRNVLDAGWDMMIAHPPCDHLASAGVAWWAIKQTDGRQQRAIEFFMTMTYADIPMIAVENPVGIMNTIYRKPDQIIHPYYFGDRDLKKTCLWLKGLPKLWYWAEDDLFGNRTMTEYPEPYNVDRTGKKRYFIDSKVRDPKERAKTFPGIAAAMAAQWG